MDLSALNSTLPQGLAEAERDMGEKFRAAALSITTLYKSSLGCNKQAYQVGYSAALSDVLSKLQSDIAAGEDAAVALARLMDWTEARQTAMAAFAADDDDVPTTTGRQSAPPPPNGTIIPHMRNAGHQRHNSAPVDGRVKGFGKDREPIGPSSLRTETVETDEPSRRLAPPSTALERSPSDGITGVPPPSSSPMGSPSITRPLVPPPLRLQRASSSRNTSSSSVNVPTSTFNFSIPTTLEIPSSSGPAQTGSIGSKRPIIDTEMADGTLPTTPSRSGGRASKRRSMANLSNLEDEKEPRSADRRRPPRRGGGFGA